MSNLRRIVNRRLRVRRATRDTARRRSRMQIEFLRARDTFRRRRRKLKRRTTD